MMQVNEVTVTVKNSVSIAVHRYTWLDFIISLLIFSFRHKYLLYNMLIYNFSVCATVTWSLPFFLLFYRVYLQFHIDHLCQCDFCFLVVFIFVFFNCLHGSPRSYIYLSCKNAHGNFLTIYCLFFLWTGISEDRTREEEGNVFPNEEVCHQGLG